MAVITSYSVDNDRRFRKAMLKTAKAMRNPKPAFREIARDFYKSQKAISMLKGPGLYPDITEQTKKRKRRKGMGKYKSGYPILWGDGTLLKSTLGPRNEGALLSITKKELVIGTTIEYGIYHQSDKPRKKIPLRKFIFIGPEAPRFATSEQMGRMERWLRILKDWSEVEINLITKKQAKGRRGK